MKSVFLRSLVLVALLLSALDAAAQATNKFENEIVAFEASDKTNKPPTGGTLFIGSSSIRLWKTLSQDLGGWKPLNRGFGGSQIEDSIHFADRIVFPYAPKTIVMYAGGNDINAKKTPERVAADFKAFAKLVHSRLPETHIAYISIARNPARWAQRDQVNEANRLIREFTETQPRLSFIEVNEFMLGPDGMPRPDIFVDDRLHMNSKGYEIWTRVVGDHLRRIAPLPKY